MPPLVYRKLVEAGRLTVADLERFAQGDRCVDARVALEDVAWSGGVLAEPARAALIRVSGEVESL